MADVATGRTSTIPVARQKCAYSSRTRSARSIGSGCRACVASSPSPMRTASWISSVRFHHDPSAASCQVNTTSRKEFDPRSTTAWRRSVMAGPYPRRPSRGPRGGRCAGSGALDELDPVAVRVADEADPGAAGADLIGRLLRLDALLAQPRERAVEILDGERDVVVARAELVGVDAEVVRELEPVAVAREAQEDVDRLVADGHAATLLEPERLVEGDGPVDVPDPVAGVDQLHGAPQRTLPRMIVERSMNTDYLSNTYLVAAQPGGEAFFVDAGGPVGPLIDQADQLR